MNSIQDDKDIEHSHLLLISSTLVSPEHILTTRYSPTSDLTTKSLYYVCQTCPVISTFPEHTILQNGQGETMTAREFLTAQSQMMS